jgi:hypothetical protein
MLLGSDMGSALHNLRINLHESAASFLGPEDVWGHPKVNEQNWTKQV